MARNCDRCGAEIKRYEYQYVDDGGNHFCRKCTDVKIKALDMMVRHRRLKTEDTGRGRIFHCAECGYRIDDIYIYNEALYPITPNFCPFCGREVKN